MVVLNPTKTLFLGGRYQLTLLQQYSGRVVVETGDAKNIHVKTDAVLLLGWYRLHHVTASYPHRWAVLAEEGR